MIRDLKNAPILPNDSGNNLKNETLVQERCILRHCIHGHLVTLPQWTYLNPRFVIHWPENRRKPARCHRSQLSLLLITHTQCRPSITLRVVDDVTGVYGYYVTDKYPFGPICTFGVHEPSFGKVPPLRWHDETSDNTTDDNGDRINGH
jgi:hypothetical protein